MSYAQTESWRVENRLSRAQVARARRLPDLMERQPARAVENAE
jgi:hypothetical protein